MLKMMNTSHHPSDREKFSNNSSLLNDFLHHYALDGLEVMQCGQDDMDWYPPNSVIGVHMRYWPMCIDFLQGNISEMRRVFGSDDVWQMYYGAKTREDFVSAYREGLQTAQAAGAKYAVFHVSNSSFEELFSHSFKQDNEQVVNAFITLINEVLDGFSCDMMLLFENMWYPGLTLLDEPLAQRMLEDIQCWNKGFMLDIGHMMITNPKLRTYAEAEEYITAVLSDRPGMLSNIKGIHLNGALTGEYLQATMRGEGLCDIEGSFGERYANAYHHVTRIDSHTPFADVSIQKVLGLVDPDYLVYELLAKDLPILEKYISEQQKFCGL